MALSSFSTRVYRSVFLQAAAYNIGFGLWAALAPHAFFELFELAPPRYPAIWACLGMVVGLYGLVYGWSAVNLDRAFPFIAIGLAGKMLGPIGWVMTVRSGEWPLRTFSLIAFNDLIWWVPFALFLLEQTAFARLVKRATPYLCAAVHLLAAIAALLWLRGGSEAVGDIRERIAYVTTHPVLWRAGWGLWMLAALTLLGFYAWWGRRVPNPRAALLALWIALGGLVCDFLGESVLIAWLQADFIRLSRFASLLMGGSANGLYTIAGIVLTLATPSLRGGFLAFTWLVWASGIALSAFTFANYTAGVVTSSAALMVFFVPWVVMAGIKLR